MKGFWGLLIIILFYVSIGLIFSNTGLHMWGLLGFTIYLILLALSVFSMVLLNMVYSKNLFIMWISFTTIPTVLISLYGYISDNGSVFSIIPWQWILWKYVIPFFWGVSQIAFIFYFLKLMRIEHFSKIDD